ELHALPHALAVGADLLVGGVHEIDRNQRTTCGLASRLLVEAVEADERGDPFEPGHPVVKRVLFWTEPDLKIQVRVLPNRFPQHLDRAFARFQLPGNELQERRLAGAIRAEKAGDSRRNLDAHVIEADDLTVPLRHVFGLDNRPAHVTTSTPRTRRSRREMESAMSPRIMMSDTGHGVA